MFMTSDSHQLCECDGGALTTF